MEHSSNKKYKLIRRYEQSIQDPQGNMKRPNLVIGIKDGKISHANALETFSIKLGRNTPNLGEKIPIYLEYHIDKIRKEPPHTSL